MEVLRETFIHEAQGLLQEMESLLLDIEAGDTNAEKVNALFRCAHTIKGSAGIFGFSTIIDFSHVVESVLEVARSGRLELAGALPALLLKCRDHIVTLIDEVAALGEERSISSQLGKDLVAQLQVYLRPSNLAEVRQAPVIAIAAHADDRLEAELIESDCWHISLRFHRNSFHRGLNPAAFLMALGQLGTDMRVEPVLNAMPPGDEMDPQSCYLGFEIELRSECGRVDIESILEFAEGDCDIRIIPPKAKLVEYAQLIRSLPKDEHLLLGEILVRSGALTERELRRALRQQSNEDARSGEPVPPLGRIVVDEGLVDAPLVSVALQQQQRSDEQTSRKKQALKVPSERLDQLIDLVGELVIASSAATLLASRKQDTELTESSLRLHELVEEIRDTALRMRMVPIGDTLSRFQRAVRDIAKNLGKDIELTISGGDTELDKSVVELIADPLMHLVRNAADHGIEAPEVRIGKGKPAAGRLSLRAHHESGSVVIEVSDDGAGLNRDKIRRKAIERGLLTEDRLMADGDLLKLIFEPGFSTADAVTNLSGRGVGMDVVKRNIEALRGTIDVESEAGAGTCMKLRLPLTLAIIDGFLIRVAESHYVIPLDLILECRDLSVQDRNEISQKGLINLRGSVLPVFRLRELFGIGDEYAGRENIVVVHYGALRAGIAVDALVGQMQVVIKPLPAVFRQLRGIGGSTILGDGTVAAILDIPGLLQAAGDHGVTHRPVGGGDRERCPNESRSPPSQFRTSTESFHA